MRLFAILSLFSVLLLSNSDCSKKKKAGPDNNEVKTTIPSGNPGRCKGKLAVAGICKNYTIVVMEGDIDKKLVEAEWTDEATSKKHINAFRLGNPCEFPATIKEGGEFYFVIDTAANKECIVCMAYYPTPSKTLSIKVIE